MGNEKGLQNLKKVIGAVVAVPLPREGLFAYMDVYAPDGEGYRIHIKCVEEIKGNHYSHEMYDGQKGLRDNFEDNEWEEESC